MSKHQSVEGMSEAINDFDNDVTIRYKRASAFEIPVKYLLTIGDGTLRSLLDFIRERVSDFENVETLHHLYRETEQYMDRESRALMTVLEFAYICYHVRIKQLSTMYVDNELRSQIAAMSHNAVPLFNELMKRIALENNETDVGYISDISELKQSYKLWFDSFEKKRLADEMETQTIAFFQSTLMKTEPLPVVNVNVNNTTLAFDPKWSSDHRIGDEHHTGTISTEDGIEIFDKAIPTFEVPIIQYFDGKRKYYRIYQGSETDGVVKPLQINIKEITDKVMKPHTFSFTVWSGVPGKSAKSKENRLITRCILPLNGDPSIWDANNKMTVTCPQTIRHHGDGREIIISRISATLPFLNMGLGREIKVNGSFMIKHIEWDKSSLHYAILNDELLSRYLYIDESNKSWAENQEYKIHYKSFIRGDASDESSHNPDSVSISFATPGNDQIRKETSQVIVSRYGEVDESDSDNDEEEEYEMIENSIRYMKINVGKARSTKVLNDFIGIFGRLLNYYQVGREQVYSYMRDFVYELDVQFETSTILPVKTDGVETKKVRMLAKRAPELFNPGDSDRNLYGSHCQCYRQPIIIEKDEKEAWEQPVIVNGVKLERTVLEYPPPNPNNPDDGVKREYYVCPDDAEPHLSFKVNPTSTADFSPYVPCCGRTKGSQEEIYKNYYSSTQKPIKSASQHQRNTPKLLAPFEYATISKKISDLLDIGMKERKIYYFRRGLSTSRSSLIHCVLFALQDRDYMSCASNAQRDAYVEAERVAMLSVATPSRKVVNPAVCKQELFDLTVSQIAANIADPRVLFDPYLYYRAVEERYDVNIFTFNNNGPLHPQELSGSLPDEKVLFDIPRSKMMHLSVERPDRKSIVVINHIGTETNMARYPRCELVYSSDVNDRTGFRDLYFTGDVGSRLYRALRLSANIMLWSFPKMGGDVSPLTLASNIEAREDPYVKVDWRHLLETGKGSTIMTQRIDNSGKMRGINVRMSNGSLLTLFIPPSQPLNVLESDTVHVGSEEEVRAYFPEGQSDMNSQGLWFSLFDVTHGIFIPTVLDQRVRYTGPPPPIQYGPKLDVDPVKEIKTVRKLSRLLLTLIEWCWRNSYPGRSTSLRDLEEWCRLYLYRVDTPAPAGVGSSTAVGAGISTVTAAGISTVTAAGISNPLGKIPKMLPRLPGGSDIDKTPLAIETISRWWPEFFGPSRTGSYAIKLYGSSDSERSLYDKVRNHLRRICTRTEGLSIGPNSYIKGLYESDEDFKTYPDSITLIDSHLQDWLKSKEVPYNKKATILSKLDIALAHRMEPYLYRDPHTDKIYMIQNVVGRDKRRALNTAIYWHYRGRNIGFDSTETIEGISIDQCPYVVYGIPASQAMMPIMGQDFSRGSPEYIQILCYDIAHQSYAAILPLL